MIMDFNLSLEIIRDVGDRIKRKKSSLRLYRKEANSFPSVEMNVAKKKKETNWIIITCLCVRSLTDIDEPGSNSGQFFALKRLSKRHESIPLRSPTNGLKSIVIWIFWNPNFMKWYRETNIFPYVLTELYACVEVWNELQTWVLLVSYKPVLSAVGSGHRWLTRFPQVLWWKGWLIP